MPGTASFESLDIFSKRELKKPLYNLSISISSFLTFSASSKSFFAKAFKYVYQIHEFKKINDVTKIKIKIVKCDISKKHTDVGFILKKNIKKLGHY